MQVRIIDQFNQLEAALDQATARVLLAAGREVQQLAIDSMKPAAGPAPPNQPPHRHYGDLAASIAVEFDPATQTVVVGPRRSYIGLRGAVLEFAGTFDPAAERDPAGRFARDHRSRTAPSFAKWAHPFMRPAIEQIASQGLFAGHLAGSFEPQP
jgi:hypothetical protein